MERFRLRDLDFALPRAALRGGLAVALSSGRYEQNEAEALLAHLQPGDRYLDLGAGMGFLCCLAARVLGPAQVTGVEAGPETLALARANLALNGFDAVELRHGAVVAHSDGAAVDFGPDGAAVDFGSDGAAVDFGMRPAFWASALKGAADWPENARVVRVPALPIAELLAQLRPTIISCDIEGAELEVLAQPLPPDLRLLVVEIHPALYGGAGTGQLFAALAAQGFVYEPRGSRGAVVVFARP